MNLAMTGATGFVGTEVLAQALAAAHVMTTFGRREAGTPSERLREVVRSDLGTWQPDDLAGIDAMIWCLGVSQLAVDEQSYVRITHDWAVAAARALFAASPGARFCFVSGNGADPDEKARARNRNIKGRTERALAALSPNAFSFRPAFIRPAFAGQKRPLVTKLFTPIADVVDLFTEGFSVGCRPLAQCLLDVAEHGAPDHVLDNRAIKNWSKP